MKWNSIDSPTYRKNKCDEEVKRPVRFISTAYGTQYIGFLLVTLFSIHKSNSESKMSVYWQDMDEEHIKALSDVLPEADFHETNFDLAGDYVTRISSKVHLWERAVSEHPDTCLCLLDSDTLVLKNIDSFFENEFDIGFTVKDEQFPINTGVVLVKNNNPLSLQFFAQWKRRTLEILSDKESFKMANSIHYPYGGSDQMSFYQMIGYKRGVNEYEVVMGNSKLKLRAFSCSVLNETRSTQITPDHHIIHYKGGWRNVLLKGENFPKTRPRHDSREMYLLYLRTYCEAIELLKSHSRIGEKDFGIKIPFYVKYETFEENRFLYSLYYMKNIAKNAVLFLGVVLRGAYRRVNTGLRRPNAQ